MLWAACGKVNCGGIIFHLFITQAIYFALFIFLQDPGHVLIICRLTALCHYYFQLKSQHKASPSLLNAANVKTSTDFKKKTVYVQISLAF